MFWFSYSLSLGDGIYIVYCFEGFLVAEFVGEKDKNNMTVLKKKKKISLQSICQQSDRSVSGKHPRVNTGKFWKMLQVKLNKMPIGSGVALPQVNKISVLVSLLVLDSVRKKGHH